MKLYLNTASPYARLIRVLLIETGLIDEVDLVFVDPWTSPEELIATNPAAKIPALRLEEGDCLIESSCIAEYLIARSRNEGLLPLSHIDAPRRLEILGLARAAMDCSFGAVVQERFIKQSPLSDRWLAALPRLAQRLERLCETSNIYDDIDLGGLTAGVTFEYIDFRLPQISWRESAPKLANAITQMSKRESFISTKPS